MGRLRSNLRAPELCDVGVGTRPTTDSVGANPDKLNVISVRDVDGIVTSLRGEQVECMVKNQASGIHRIVSVHVDIIAPCIVGFGNVRCVVREPGVDLLVGFRDERRVAVGCLASRILVGISGEVDALVAAGSDGGRVDNRYSGSCSSGFGGGGDVPNG